MDIVIAGAGLTAAKTAETLRQEGLDGSITIIGSERWRPYERPGLSKEFLQGADELESLFVHGESWARDHDVTLQTDDTVTTIDRSARTVALASGGSVGYDALVLATGAQARRLNLPGADYALTLRDIDDSTRLKDSFVAGDRLIVIGAGWIGLEAAAAARLAGMQVTVLEAARHPLEAAMGSMLGDYFAELHRRQGVDVQTGVTVEEIIHDGQRATGVRVDGRNLDAEVVLMGVGAAPSVELARAAGLQTDNGVVADERLRTDDTHILAAGDVVNAYNTARGEQIRVEHWDNAIRQGELAARSILGHDAVYDWQPYFFTDQYDLGMEYVGMRGADDEAVIRGELDAGEFIVFWQAGDRISAAMNVNIWDVNDDLRALIGKSADAQKLADADIALADLP